MFLRFRSMAMKGRALLSAEHIGLNKTSACMEKCCMFKTNLDKWMKLKTMLECNQTQRTRKSLWWKIGSVFPIATDLYQNAFYCQSCSKYSINQVTPEEALSLQFDFLFFIYSLICVCMYVCMHACMYACIELHRVPYGRLNLGGQSPAKGRTCMHTCMYAWMHVCTNACMHVCMYACM